MKRLLIYLFILLQGNILLAQDNLKLNNSAGLSQVVKACTSINLVPGFTFKAATGKSLTLRTDNSVCSPANLNANISANQNYIVTVTPRNETGSVSFSNGKITLGRTLDANTEAMVSIQYYDGLGRPNQNSQVGASPGGSDLISLQQYDDFGRQSKSWLPAPASSNGAYIENAISTIKSYYKDSAYSYPVYEQSPLNRVLEQYGPGNDWQKNGKSVKTAYKTNTASGDLACYKFKVNGSGESTSLAKDNYYANGSLYVTEMKDEDNKVSYEFKDKLGQVVLTRQMDKTDTHDTYYIYDDFGNLSYVLPPMLSDAIIKNSKSTADTGTEMKQFAYIYKYDARNRCVKKKLPGCDPIYYVYDKADRLIYSQDGEQRKQGKWSYIKYDAFGRVILTGENKLKNSTPSQESLHKQLRDKYQNIVAIESAVLGRSNVPPFGYTLSTLNEVTDLDAVQIVNHYDDYSHLLDQEQLFRDHLDYNEKSGYGKRYWDTNLKNQSAKGLLTGTRVKHVDDHKKEVVTAFYYDERGRVIQTKSTNHMGGVDKEYIAYNFTGQPVKKLVEHTGNYLPSANQLNEEYTYKYDHAGRLLTTIRNGETIESLAYNELGQLAGKTQGEELANTYEYNIRGWMKKHKESKTQFEQELFYSFNGNISRMDFIQGNDEPCDVSYTYDELNRMTISAIASHYNNGRIVIGAENLQYDKNGNIVKRTATSRGLTSPVEDKLNISYDGNQLSTVFNDVSTQGSTTVNYPGGNSSFTYNTNGSLISDSGRGIVTIEYNSLNLPKLIQFNNGNQIQYIYASDGQKLRAKHITAKQGVVQPVTNGQIRELKPSEILSVLQTDYVGNTVLTTEGEQGVAPLAEYKVLFGNGYDKYVLTDTKKLTYDKKSHYQLTDYLGNIRSTKVKGQALEVTEYHAFGTPFRRFKGEMSSDPYKHGGKEFDRMHGLNWYDFHARQYDPVLARFHTMDPLAEKRPWISPYAYCRNNPLRFIDPNGMEEYEYDKDGNRVKISDIGDQLGIKIYHTGIKNKDGKEVSILIDKDGNTVTMTGGREVFKRGEIRNENVGYGTVTNEYLMGDGPERSIFEGDHPSNKAILNMSSYQEKKQQFESMDKNVSKKAYEVDWGVKDVFTTTDGQAQMMGTYNLSFYKLGNNILSLAIDSKSKTSLFYHLPFITNSSRSTEGAKALTTTHQIYIFWGK